MTLREVNLTVRWNSLVLKYTRVSKDLRGLRPQGLKLPQLLLTLRHGVEQRRLYLEFKSLKGKYIYEIVTSLILIMNHHEAGNITKYFCITKNYYKS